MSFISVVFCLGYLVHGIYDWVIYLKYKHNLMIDKMDIIWAEMTWLSIVWTLMPVLTIYLMHRKNFKSQDTIESEVPSELEKRLSQGISPLTPSRLSETEFDREF